MYESTPLDRSEQTDEPAEPARPDGRRRRVGALAATAVERRNRLSRSRDFDAVYRQGRSTSTRFLVLYWFRREDGDPATRLGIAVPRKTGGAVTRNRLKRQLREVWRLLPDRPEGRDFVLLARPGLAEAAEARGFPWLQERVQEVLGKASV